MPSPDPRAVTADETLQQHEVPLDQQPLVPQVVSAEYGLFMAALGAAWSASLMRTSLFLAVVSAAGLVLGFAAQRVRVWSVSLGVRPDEVDTRQVRNTVTALWQARCSTRSSTPPGSDAAWSPALN